MPLTPVRLLIANRGEIAIRIARACAELNTASVVVYATDDATSLHVRKGDAAVALPARGVAAYLDGAALVAAALAQGCDAIHPGYGFLAENADFARACADAGLTFVGPAPEVLELFGDKARAREFALGQGVPVVPGESRAVTLAEAEAFFAKCGPLMIKALAGGGGRGMRVVTEAAALADAYERCRSEALGAFGCADVYVEKYLPRARHIEIQVLGDGTGAVVSLGERECSLQRRHQKLVEMAPAPNLSDRVCKAMTDAALRLTAAARLRGAATVEFLLDAAGAEDFYFIEVNPRIQVEHTVTEMISGVDLVQAQLRLACGATLASLGLSATPVLQGAAVQVRVNLESMHEDGSTRAAAGVLSAHEPPSGPGIRVDGYGYTGYRVNPNYDSLLAKVIVQGADHAAAMRRAYRALCEFRLEGVASNLHFLQNLVQAVLNPPVTTPAGILLADTAWVGRHLEDLLAPREQAHQHLYFSGTADAAAVTPVLEVPPDCLPLFVPGAGSVVSLEVQEDDIIAEGQTIAVLEAMKMEFLVKAPRGGRVRRLLAQPGDVLAEGSILLYFEALEDIESQLHTEEAVDLDFIRRDLAEVLERQAITRDESRPDAVARRRRTGQRTTRENLADLLDADSFIEYGALAVAAQRKRRSLPALIRQSPADGLVAGVGTVNAGQFGEEKARCMVLAYDYTVFAGTQGLMNHKKTDRMLQLAERNALPLVLFAEGGGGRPGDTDYVGVSGLDCPTFLAMARLSGLVPLVGVVSGRCFAGNAALLGCCDAIIAARDSTIGMAGPAMIEGGGLGKFKPEEVGPVSVQAPNGVIDVVVADEAEAVAVARKYLGYFQGAVQDWQAADQRKLRHLIPENRLRVYDMREVIATLADKDSVLELRREFAAGMITALIRIEGRPFGLIANNPGHLGGAIDAAAGDKAARFMQLCDAFDLPILSLCDTPGFMVGPDAERQATVRHVSRMFVTAASLDVPFFTVVLRKGYGLGAQAMAAGSFHAPFFIVAWPSGEFGAMGLEGAIRLGFTREMAAIEDPARRERFFRKMVGRAYRAGKGINMASYLEIDDVIDPLETRRWILRGLKSSPQPLPRRGKKRPLIDTW